MRAEIPTDNRRLPRGEVGRQKEGRPAIEVVSWVMSDILLGIFALLAGLVFCFRGYMAMRVVIPIWGAFTGFMLGAGLVANLGNEGFLVSALGWVVGAVLAEQHDELQDQAYGARHPHRRLLGVAARVTVDPEGAPGTGGRRHQDQRDQPPQPAAQGVPGELPAGHAPRDQGRELEDEPQHQLPRRQLRRGRTCPAGRTACSAGAMDARAAPCHARLVMLTLLIVAVVAVYAIVIWLMATKPA